MLACVSTAALPFAVASAAPATRRARVNVGVGFGVGVTARAPPFGSLAGTRNPPGGATLDVHTMRHHIHVGRVNAPWDATQVVTFQSGRDWTAQARVDGSVSLRDVACDLDVAVAALVTGAGPLPAARDGVGPDLGGNLGRQASDHTDTSGDGLGQFHGSRARSGTPERAPPWLTDAACYPRARPCRTEHAQRRRGLNHRRPSGVSPTGRVARCVSRML